MGCDFINSWPLSFYLLSFIFLIATIIFLFLFVSLLKCMYITDKVCIKILNFKSLQLHILFKIILVI